MNPAKLAVEDVPGWKFRTQDLTEDLILDLKSDRTIR